jgi:molybdopterin converting factor subunit 1
MSYTVQLFARARDLAGASRAELQLAPGATVNDLLTALTERHPALAPLRRSLLVAVNHDYATPETIVPEDAEIACFPPVSGG